MPKQSICSLAGTIGLLLVLMTIGCNRQSSNTAGTPPSKDDQSQGAASIDPARVLRVTVTNYPLEYFVRRIGGSPPQ